MSASATTSYFVRTALGSMVRSPFVHVIAVATLTLALFGFGVTRVVTAQVNALLASLGGEVELTVYLADGAEEAQVAQLQAALAQRTGGTVQRVSPAQALGRLSDALGDQGQGLTELSNNPLPWSLEVSLPAQGRDATALAELAQRTRGLPFVTGVDYGEEALKRLELLSRALAFGALIAFALVFLTTVVIVSATLQLAIFARRDEIEIQKLVGATDRFVRVPFLIEGLLQGLLAGAVSLGLLLLAVRFLSSDRAELVSFLRVSGGFAVDWRRLASEQLGAGMALGLLGSFVAVRRFLRV